MELAVPIQKEIVLIGGGHAHVAVLRSFGMRPIPGVRLTLISPDYDTPYSGMLPGFLAGHYSFSESHINLIPLCQFAGAQFYRDSVVGLDLQKKKILCQNRPEISFDFLSIDTGSTPTMDSVPGAKEFGIPVKPVKRFLERWHEIEQSIKTGGNPSSDFTIVGGGAGGVELTLSLHHRLQEWRKSQKSNKPSFSFTLVTASQEILSTHNEHVRQSYSKVLHERSIALKRGFRVNRVEQGKIYDTEGNSHPFDHLLWVTHASAPSWLKEAGLETDDRGFIAVNDRLQSVSHPFVFAAGDVATMLRHPRPKSGVYAVRQGPPLTQNLRHSVHGEALGSYRPQERFLSLISTGDQYAIASKGNFTVQGKWVWKWKDQIDRRFMRRYQELPKMDGPHSTRPKATRPLEDPAPDYHKIRCTGCGSKIGSNSLERVIKRLSIPTDTSISIGLNAPDDAAVIKLPSKSPLIQTVDFFPSFLSDPWLFAQIATLHCLSDILAMGATPHSAQMIVTLPFGLDAYIEETLFQVMSGTLKILNEHDTKLIGGHTLEGDKLALGMTVNGTTSAGDLMRKTGLRPGDRLILTKPIGTGIILAALMQGTAPSRWLAAAVATMKRSNRMAPAIMREHQVVAATDVTGFGLLGHLIEMLRASKVSASLKIDHVPIIEGATQGTQAGIRSSLYAQNERLSEAIQERRDAHENPKYPILFDPQTSGGLLFGVPESRASSCLSELREAGYADASEIGVVEPSEGQHSSIRIQS